MKVRCVGGPGAGREFDIQDGTNVLEVIVPQRFTTRMAVDEPPPNANVYHYIIREFVDMNGRAFLVAVFEQTPNPLEVLLTNYRPLEER